MGGIGEVERLVTGWRERAAMLRRYGAREAAETLEAVTAELEAALRAARDELLTLEAAARVSGYSADYLGRLVREGKIPNAGRPHAPKIRRADLPRKAVRLPTEATGPILAVPKRRIARAVMDAHRQEVRDG